MCKRDDLARLHSVRLNQRRSSHATTDGNGRDFAENKRFFKQPEYDGLALVGQVALEAVFIGLNLYNSLSGTMHR